MSSTVSPVSETGTDGNGQTLFNFLRATLTHAQKCHHDPKPKKEKTKTQKQKVRDIKNAKREKRENKTRYNLAGEPIEQKTKEEKTSPVNEEKIKSLLDGIETKHKAEIEKIKEFNALIKFQVERDARNEERIQEIKYLRSEKGKAQKELNAIIQREFNEWKGHPELNTGQLTDQDTQHLKEQTKEVINTEKKYSFEPDTKKIIIREASELQPVEQMQTFHKTTKTISQRIGELMEIIKK